MLKNGWAIIQYYRLLTITLKNLRLNAFLCIHFDEHLRLFSGSVQLLILVLSCDLLQASRQKWAVIRSSSVWPSSHSFCGTRTPATATSVWWQRRSRRSGSPCCRTASGTGTTVTIHPRTRWPHFSLSRCDSDHFFKTAISMRDDWFGFLEFTQQFLCVCAPSSTINTCLSHCWHFRQGYVCVCVCV